MQIIVALLVGIVLIGGSVGLLRLAGPWVRRLSRRRQLGLAVTAWLGETVLLLLVGGFVVGSLVPLESLADGLPSLLVSESVLAGSVAGALAVLRGAWGVPTLADVGLAWDRAKAGQVARDVGFGLALGPVAVGVFLVAGLIGGWDRITGIAAPPVLVGNLVLGAVLFALVGVAEELSSRGCLFALVARWIGLPAAWVISVGVFGLLHGFNPGATPFAVAGVALAGVVFAFALLRSGALWLPIAFHLSWDWAETSLYGFPDSGQPPASALQLQIDRAAPEWATGGAFGPEASAFVVVALALAAGAIWFYTRGRDGRALLFPHGTPERAEGLSDEERGLSNEQAGFVDH
jgi:membrane protease YdiL (CAAX protease family)